MEKKTHVKKVLILSNKKRKILYISKLYLGAKHDFSMLKQEFSPSLPWFKEFTLWLDSGFQGTTDCYQTASLHLSIRRKRPKKGEKSDLTPTQIDYNKSVSKGRIFVEHSIAGLKRFRILYNRIRIKNDLILNAIIDVSAALWNFNISS